MTFWDFYAQHPFLTWDLLIFSWLFIFVTLDHVITLWRRK